MEKVGKGEDMKRENGNGSKETPIQSKELVGNNIIQQARKIKSLPVNILTEVLREYLSSRGISIRYDSFSNKMFIGNEELTKNHEVLLMCKLEELLGRGISRGKLHDAIQTEALSNEFDRLNDYLLSCRNKWDGVRRIESFWTDVFNRQQDEYGIATARYFFLSLVKRAFDPGCLAKSMIVLQGPRSIGKSSVLRLLGGEFFKEVTTPMTKSKKFLIALQGSWLVEFPELEAIKSVNRGIVKSLISVSVDRFRMPYKKYAMDFPRRCMLVGTTSSKTFYSDPYGGTRYYPVEVEQKANLSYVEKLRDQLWGEAMALYETETNTNIEVPSELVEERQRNTRIKDEWEKKIEDYIAKHNIKYFRNLSEVAYNVFRIKPYKISGHLQTRITDALHALGWRRKAIWLEGKPQNVWLKD